MSLQKWDTVTCKIVALDITCQPPKILLRKASPGSVDHPLEEPVIKVGDRIDSAKVLDVNFSRASVQITGTKFASSSKVRARVVHVTIMTDATPVSRPRRKVGVESAQEKETIGKAHPFYK